MKYTITKTTHTGLMEWLTDYGFRSEKAIKENGYKKLYFEQSAGLEKIKELQSDCRLPKIKKSIILNYS